MKRSKHLFLFILIMGFICLFYSSPLAQTNGDWAGSTSQGHDVFFVSTGNTIQSFTIEICVSGGAGGFGCFEQHLNLSMPVSGNNFSYNSGQFDLKGTFTGTNTVTGTWSFHDGYMGYGNGNWSAGYPAPPILILSPSTKEFNAQAINSKSNIMTFTLKNKGGGNATGSVSLTGTNADQFEITSGKGNFSLAHDQSKNIDVRFTPKTMGSKSATLRANGTIPTNDVNANLSGIGTDNTLSISPTCQTVSENSGRTFFSVSNTGTLGSMFWTASTDPADTWLSIKWGYSGTNNGSIIFDYEANDGGARVGIITVMANSVANSPQSVIVFQAANRSKKLIASDGAPNDSFGQKTSISGDYAIVGAYRDDGNDSGSVYLYKRTGTEWIQKAKLRASDGLSGDYFGSSVIISGDYVVIGARGYTANGADSGSAYIFEKPNTGWMDMTETAKLLASDGAENDRFGASVGLSGNYVVVGAPNDDDNGTNSGSIYVFKKPLGGWVNMTETSKYTADDGASGDYFGCSVSISGNVFLAGAYGDKISGRPNTGSVYVFERTNNHFVEQAKLTTTKGSNGDFFGSSVCLDGNTALVGSYRDIHYQSNAGSDGSAYIFEKPVGGWMDMTDTAKLKESDGAIVTGKKDSFGLSVSISGDTAIIGAHGDDPNGTDSGSIYIFKKPVAGWEDMTETAKYTAKDGSTYDYFGSSVGISGQYAIVGADGDNDNGTDSGSAYVYNIGDIPSNLSTIGDHAIPTYYYDSDSDGFGDPDISSESCSPPAEYVSNNKDCDDENDDVHPGSLETFNNIDDNCDGIVDNIIPEKVTLTSPSGIIQDKTPILAWNEDFYSTWYKLFIWDSSKQKVYAQWYDAAEICSLGNCNITLESELRVGDYEYYIKSWNDYGKVWSDGMAFTIQVDDTPPSQIVQISPAGLLESSLSTFTWVADPVSTWYKLWIGYINDERIFTKWYEASNICSDGICTVSLGTEFISGDYEWYIKSWNDYGNSWSGGLDFTVTE